MKNIALIGFMASGKTTIGKMLASEMHFEFTDTDFLVEKDENKKISDIFKTHGEAYFREAEHSILKHVAEQPRQVISTGGGILTIPKNIAVLKEYRGLGLGKVITEKLINACKQKNLPFISLEVRVSNKTAINLYEGLGFECLGERKSFYNNPREDAYIYTLYF